MIATATTSRQQTLWCDRESLQEWEDTMRTSNTRARKFSSTVGKIVMALVFASMIGGISIAPAFGRDNDRREGHHERGRYEHGTARVHHAPVATTTRHLSMRLHRSSMPRPRISRRASASSSPSTFDRGNPQASTAQRVRAARRGHSKTEPKPFVTCGWVI